MAKKFNKFIYYASSLLYILDSELSFKFNDNKSRDSGLPVELEQLSIDKHYEIYNCIREFVLKVRDNQPATLKLSSADINHLGIGGYKKFSQQTEKYKCWNIIYYYEIRDNTLIRKKICNLYFFTRKMWRNETCIYFYIENNLVKQKQKVIYKLNQKYENDEYREVHRFEKSKLIESIFTPKYVIKNSLRKLDSETAYIISKLKSIEVKENKLVITA